MKHIALFFAAALTMFLTNGLVFAQDTTLTITPTGVVRIGHNSPAFVNNLAMHVAKRGPNNSTLLVSGGDNSNTYGGILALGENLVAIQGMALKLNAISNRIHFASDLNGDSSVMSIGGYSGANAGVVIGRGFSPFFAPPVNGLLVEGNVGIATGSPDQLLSVNGNASKVGGGTWATFSDRRVKQDINSFTDGLSVIEGIRPVTFRYNGKLGYPTDKTYVGVIAQEIQSVAPYTVDTYRTKLDPEDVEETDILRFDGSALTYIAINAIKELQKENQSLADRLAELETLVKSLTAERTSGGNGSLGELR